MKKLKIITLLLLNIILIESCLTQSTNYDEKISKQELFKNYLDAFQPISIPIILDRNAVFELPLKGNDINKEIHDNMLVFIPDELKKENSRSKFISLYLLPIKNNFQVVLLIRIKTLESSQNNLEVLLITYNSYGEIVDYQEVAGYIIDSSEAFLEITSGYKIKRNLYQFKINNDNEYSHLFHLIEHEFEYQINTSGLIEEIHKSVREGFFDGDTKGYELVKLIK